MKALNIAESYKLLNREEQEEVIKSYIPLVRRVVHRLAGRMPKDVDLKEMLNSGLIGLVDALEKFDPAKETNFATYAQFRIRGAILDSFRSQDWAPRSLRYKAHRIQEAFNFVEQKLGRPATEEEVATELNIDLEHLRSLLGEVSSVVMMSFEELGFGHGEEKFSSDAIQSQIVDPVKQLLGAEKIRLIARALDRLPENERLVISLYFYEELNLKEIGEILEVTESRASQVRSRALLRLRNYLKNALS